MEAGYAVITGGYQGTMEAASKGAAEAGGVAIGVTAPPLFPGRHGANRYVTELIETTTIPERIGVMVERASGALALPGSIGTATELLVVWNINHITRENDGSSLPTVAIGPGWDAVRKAIVSEVGARADDIHVAETADKGVTWLLARLKNR